MEDFIMCDEKNMVEESAEKFVEATDKAIEVINKNCTMDMLLDMDPGSFEMLQVSMKLISAYKELILRQSKAMDELTDGMDRLLKKINYMDDKIDKLGKKNITEK